MNKKIEELIDNLLDAHVQLCFHSSKKTYREDLTKHKDILIAEIGQLETQYETNMDTIRKLEITVNESRNEGEFLLKKTKKLQRILDYAKKLSFVFTINKLKNANGFIAAGQVEDLQKVIMEYLEELKNEQD